MKKWAAAWIIPILCTSLSGTVLADGAEQNSEVPVHRVNITDERFAPDVVHVGKERTFVLEIRNVGKAAHNFVLPELDVYTYHLRSGERMRLTMRVDKPGSYRFFLDVAGVPEAGLSGRLLVR